MSYPKPQTPHGALRSDPLEGTSYRAVRQLGAGGAGVIYEAVHLGLNKPVAVKVLRRGLSDEAPMQVERMRIEAQALAQLRSPHLVEVSDFGATADGRPFYVMELLQGTNLVQELRQRGHLAQAEVIELGHQILKGLSVAHRAGFVHRDIKLENLFLTHGEGGGRLVKILDFGIAKVLPHAEGVERAAMQTNDGTILGTPRFMAPEQVLGRGVDARADLYSVGVVLYELLTGRDPFHDIEGTAPLLQAAVSAEPPLPSRVTDEPIEPVIENVVMRALAKRPGDRYANAKEFAAALAHAAEIMGATGRAPIRAPSPRGAPLQVAVLLVLASAALSAVFAIWLTRTP